MNFKALTVSQPFASLLVDPGDDGNPVKPCENRTWECLYRGPLAIHAGKGTQYLMRSELAKYVTSAIVGVCYVRDCIHVPTARHAWERGENYRGWEYGELGALLSNEHCEGPFAIVLQDVGKLNVPIPIGGKQGLWTVPAEFTERLETALPVPF